MPDRMASDDPLLVASVKLGEGLFLRAYPDPLSPRGKMLNIAPNKRPPGWATLSGAPWTIGYGSTGPDIKDGLTWTKDQAEAALRTDLANACAVLDQREPWWRWMSVPRQRVLAELCFNLGFGHLITFHRALVDMQTGNYAGAADELESSLWASQVGARAKRLADAMRNGGDLVAPAPPALPHALTPADLA